MKRIDLLGRFNTSAMLFTPTATYKAMCVTTRIAREISGVRGDVCTYSALFDSPYCLRIVRAYRTPAVQAYRDRIAFEIRARLTV